MVSMVMRRAMLAAPLALLPLAAPRPAAACSRALWNVPGRGVYVGRNMDWFEDLRSNIWILPRGLDQDGATPVNPARWTSRYGSLVITGYDAGVTDGVNEAGLAGHMLYLPETSTASRDPSVPGLSLSQWLAWYLDTCADVAEVVARTRENPWQLRMATEPGSGKAVTVHLAMNDRGGDTAILELIDGRVSIFHDRRFVVMTNQPRFEAQLANLRRFQGFGGQERLPGTHEPADRFVRAAYYVTHLPVPESERLAVAALMSVMRNVSAPFGISDPARPNVSTTIWRAVYSLGQGTLYYDSVVSPNTFWLRYAGFDYAPQSGVRKLTLVDNFDLVGDVGGAFRPAAAFTPLPANE
jgi:choloylglycine hydrolase